MRIAPQGSRTPASSDLGFLCGRCVVEFFPELCRLRPEVTEIRFATYRREPGLSARLSNMLSAEDDKLRGAAEKICDEHGIPFWNALLAIAVKRGEALEKFVDAALVHAHDPSTQTYVFPRKQVSCARITSLIQQLPQGHGLVACSRVRLMSGQTVHIPMLDFLCPYSEQNEKAIRRMLRSAGQLEGILAHSGRSYHFYGTFLLSADDWIRFAAKALLVAPITDLRYIAHRLIDGECRLKIVDSKDGSVPTITAALRIDD